MREKVSRKKIQRKIADGRNRMDIFFKHLRGSLDWLKLPLTIFFQKVNIFTRRELIRIKNSRFFAGSVKYWF